METPLLMFPLGEISGVDIMGDARFLAGLGLNSNSEVIHHTEDKSIIKDSVL